MTGLEDVVSSRDLDVAREFRDIVVFFVSMIEVVGVLWRFSSASFCCAKAHSVVELFGTRAGSGGNERCVLSAGGGPVEVSIPLLLCDAGAFFVRFSRGREDAEIVCDGS
jgi:hypothetical protein